jgi:hypothetical protein
MTGVKVSDMNRVPMTTDAHELRVYIERVVTYEQACLEAGNDDGFRFWRGLRNQAEDRLTTLERGS